MSITAAAMSQLLTLTQERNYYQMQQIYWSNEHTAMTAKVKQYSKLEAKWEKYYNEAIGNTKELDSRGVHVGKDNPNEELAEQYANAMCSEYEEETMIELSAQEVEYESMQQLYETLLNETNARIDQQKELVKTNATDTGLINGG